MNFYEWAPDWETSVKGCAHEWVNVGFIQVKEVCKKCDKEKENEERTKTS